MSDLQPKILAFIPAYNCALQIPRVLAQFNERILAYVHEIIVVNNRSTDDTETAALAYAEKHPEVPIKILRNRENYGLGGSHKVAFHYAVAHGFDYVIVLHGDDQGHIENILPYLESGAYRSYDCFLGARFMKGAQLDGYSRFRTFGNCVYNLLFSAVVHQRIYDLGSGLNLYSTRMLKDNFFEKYKDNLMFNYCMILGSAYHHHKMCFFPIRWSESDQVSNVKMVNQAITVLKMLGSYFLHPARFVASELREKSISAYDAVCIYPVRGVDHEG